MHFAERLVKRSTLTRLRAGFGMNRHSWDAKKRQGGNQVNGQTTETQWIEIIRVRLADTADGGEVQRLFGELSSSAADDRPLSFRAVLFKSAVVQTDWSIHLIQVGKQDALAPSPLGTYLSRSLQALGIVNHSIWEKCS